MVLVETECEVGVLAVFGLEVFELAKLLEHERSHLFLQDLRLQKKFQGGRKERIT
jgi:hypothetical protein